MEGEYMETIFMIIRKVSQCVRYFCRWMYAPGPLRSNIYNYTCTILTREKRGGWFMQGKPEYIVTSITHTHTHTTHNGYMYFSILFRHTCINSSSIGT